MDVGHEYYSNYLATNYSDNYRNQLGELIDNERMANAYDEITKQANGMMKTLRIVSKAFSELQTEIGRRSQDDEN
jgi:hypothetical protein